MYKNFVRGFFIFIILIWMFVLSFAFIYEKRLSVQTMYSDIDFETIEQTTSNLPQGIKITKPGVKGKRFTVNEYIPVINKSLNLRSYTNEVASDSEIIYTGNGIEADLKSDLNSEFGSKVDSKSENELYQNLKSLSITFFSESKESSDTNFLNVGKLEFLMDNCKFYNSVDVKIDKTNLVLTLGEIAESSLCAKYNVPESPVQIDCTNCDLAPVDKNNSLSAYYIPNVVPVDFIAGGFNIKETVYEPLRQMYIAAQNDGINFKLTSSYRSYSVQKETFDGWVAYEMSFGRSYDQAVSIASTYSALPGHSEHQLGTTADINSGKCDAFTQSCPDNDYVWAWLRNNAHKFGFVMSYQKGKENLTGYVFEPWHYRWIGVELATLYKERYESISYTTEFLRNVGNYSL